MPTSPPNADLAELCDFLGTDSVQLLVRTFLREYPALLHELETGDRATRQRLAHSLKSNAKVIGARGLAERLASLEARLAEPTAANVTDAELAEVRQEFDALAIPLRSFVG